jgi:hypothetical protein
VSELLGRQWEIELEHTLRRVLDARGACVRARYLREHAGVLLARIEIGGTQIVLSCGVPVGAGLRDAIRRLALSAAERVHLGR